MGYEWGTDLFSSPHRFDVLGSLHEEPTDTRGLTEELSASRVTVQRHLNACGELGWVEKVDGRYELTAVGDLVYLSAKRFLDRLSALERHGPVVGTFADRDPAFDPLLLEEATVTVATPTNPHAPISHYRTAMTDSETSSVRGISPIVSDLFIEVHGRLLADGVETELIMPRPVLERVPEPEEPPPGAFTLRTLEDSVDFGLTLTDDTALVGRYEDGTFAACVENDTPAFREWVKDVYERYRERSTVVARD
ncbi:helix-turn-helix transcriptional regulator [Saliphagus infecundisoli]|uniref:Helix-turn-helix transcriptional regulator n=1 Tax=Saliphagus infecundisoli TaxID=1849069 RepID=A0ABD5QEK2_9EURY|nr:hypothetical protein [Saliphagus infecundisoli]